MNEDNLKPFNKDDPESVEKARDMGRKGGIISGEVKREKKKISQIYADFLVKKYKLTTGEEMTGAEMADRLISQEIEKGGNVGVSLLRELREATEGNKVDVTVNSDLIEAIKRIQ